MKLISLSRHQYNRRDLRPGDDFEATEIHARLLIAMGRAERVAVAEDKVVRKVMKPKTKAKRETLKLEKKKGKRNLGDDPDFFGSPHPASEVSEAFSKQGTYNRRDMRAKDDN